MTITAQDYRAALRRHPAGVAVITLRSESGPVGFTATSFASLSLEPPLVSFNITHTSSSVASLRAADAVVVHLLSADQLPVAQRFSRDAAQRFVDSTVWTTLDTGEPLLLGTPTWLRATVHQLIPAGDSTLVIGHVTRIHCEGLESAPAPLLYHDGAFLGAGPIGD